MGVVKKNIGGGNLKKDIGDGNLKKDIGGSFSFGGGGPGTFFISYTRIIVIGVIPLPTQKNSIINDIYIIFCQ